MRHWLLMTLMLAAPPAFGYSKEWDFNVTLDHHELGQHRFVIESQGPYLKVDSDATFDYKLLLFSVFKYVHHDVEYWKGDCLTHLVSTTRTNDTHEEVRAEPVNDQLRVEHAGGWAEYSGCVKSFAYWNPDILKERRLLNSQTGEYMHVTINKIGRETIDVKGEPVTADRYHIQGKELSIDIWYVDDEWVALQASAAGGKLLRYKLK